MDALHAAIAIGLAIVMILRFRVDPVISLTISCLYLGLAAGVGFADTVEAITGGFGDIMMEVGLLIGFGVLIGALLHSMGTFADLVAIIARRMGRKLPYAMTATLATIFPSIYVDVQVVLASPMARESAPEVDERDGLPWLAGALGIGIFSGYVFVVPGLSAVAISGQLDVSLGQYLLFGVPIGLATALITTWLFRVALKAKYWDPATDVEDDGAVASSDEAVEPVRTGLSLGVRLLPILVPLVLIAFGAIADLRGFDTPFIRFLGDANVALFLGLLIAFVLARATLGEETTTETLSSGFHTTGEILLITGIGGSLGAVIIATGLDATLKDLFSADSGASVLVTLGLAWIIAAVLHFAIGSVSVAAITAGGIIGPVVGSTGVEPVVVGLAIASGAMFALHVNSNFFWMFKSLLGLSTKGALKTLTAATSLGAIVSLPLVLGAAVVTGIG